MCHTGTQSLRVSYAMSEALKALWAMEGLKQGSAVISFGFRKIDSWV